jgi:hypothetical protein
VPPRQILAWLSGQTDNIGDSALRRGYAATLSDIGEVTAWVGDPALGYATGLGLTPGSISPSFWSWYRRLAAASRARGSVFAFNAGEFVVTKEYFFGILAIAPLLLVLRARGGKIVWLGAAVRERKRGFTFPFIWLARIADVLRWRDTASSQVLGVHAETMPDWAFALESCEGDPRPRKYLAVSLRVDREPPTPEWRNAVAELAARLGLSLITVTQVQRDAPLARSLAGDWGCEFLDWQSDSHAVQESVVRQVYSQAAIVLSDRLHALIIASTEGAVPLGWTTQESAKVGRHFDAVGLNGIALGHDAGLAALKGLDASALRQRQADLGVVVIRSKARLAEVQRELVSAISASPRYAPGVDATATASL